MTNTREIGVQANKVKVFPTLFESEINVELKTESHISGIKIYSIGGGEIFSFKGNNTRFQTVKIPGNLPKGGYLIQIQTESISISKRILKL